MHKLTKIKLPRSEQRVLDWITSEWESEWNTELNVEVEGPIDFKISKYTLFALVSKGIIAKESCVFLDVAGNSCFHCIFYPLTVLKYYCGVDFQLLQDPTGKPFLSLQNFGTLGTFGGSLFET